MGRGGRFVIKTPRRGGILPREGGGGWEGVCGEVWGELFFWGPKCPPRIYDSAKSKRGRREGDGKKMSRQFATNVTTIYDMSRQFVTFYDNFRLYIPLT